MNLEKFVSSWICLFRSSEFMLFCHAVFIILIIYGVGILDIMVKILWFDDLHF
jgi:hypothetical protein